MALTVNNVSTLALLRILNRTSIAQAEVLYRLATGSRINRGADDPAGLLALNSLESELTGVNAAISSNQRTDAILGVADGALRELAELTEEIERLASETASTTGLSAAEIAANQSQIDDALASIDRIISTTQFNGRKLLDGSLGIVNTVANKGAITDVRVFSRKSGDTDASLIVKVTAAASNAVASGVMTSSATEATTFSIQGKLGVAVISLDAGDKVSAAIYKINQAKGQTGVSATGTSTNLKLSSTEQGTAAFVRTKLLDGSGISDKSDSGADAQVTVNGQQSAVDGNAVQYSGGGVAVSFQIGTLGVGSSTTLTVKGEGGATFQLGSTAGTRATIGIDGSYTHELGNGSDGYLSSLESGGANSLVNDPVQAALIARQAAAQVAQLRGRIGGFQKYQVQTALDSLNDTREGLETAQGVIRDVDYAAETAELNRQTILMQSVMQLLALVNQQQSAQVLSLLR